MNSYDLKEVLRLHKLWFDGDPAGRRADLRDADLRDADLRDADLRGADLRDACLTHANLSGQSIEFWCDLHNLDHHEQCMRIAYKRLPENRQTGEAYNGGKHIITWTSGATVEAPDFTSEESCGGGLHVSPSAEASLRYSHNETIARVAFDPDDAVNLGDKLKLRKCIVLD